MKTTFYIPLITFLVTDSQGVFRSLSMKSRGVRRKGKLRQKLRAQDANLQHERHELLQEDCFRRYARKSIAWDLAMGQSTRQRRKPIRRALRRVPFSLFQI